MVMAIVDSAAVLFIQWGTYTEPTYTAPSTVDETTRLLNSIRGQLTRFVAQMWMEQNTSGCLISVFWAWSTWC